MRYDDKIEVTSSFHLTHHDSKTFNKGMTSQEFCQAFIANARTPNTTQRCLLSATDAIFPAGEGLKAVTALVQAGQVEISSIGLCASENIWYFISSDDERLKVFHELSEPCSNHVGNNEETKEEHLPEGTFTRRVHKSLLRRRQQTKMANPARHVVARNRRTRHG